MALWLVLIGMAHLRRPITLCMTSWNSAVAFVTESWMIFSNYLRACSLLKFGKKRPFIWERRRAACGFGRFSRSESIMRDMRFMIKMRWLRK